MSVPHKQSGKDLAKRWGLNVRHALYRKTGDWYNRLSKFPGALLDAKGYVIFDSEHTFRSCPHLRIGKQVRASHGIKVIPGYVQVVAHDFQIDSMLDESLMHEPSGGQGRRALAESRRAVEAYAMQLAISHYSKLWRVVKDVSPNAPFDLLCRNGERELRVEVKGTTSIARSVLLTKNEVQHARENAGRVALFVVSQIVVASENCKGGTISVFEPWDISLDELEPIAFECHLLTRPNNHFQRIARRRAR